MNMNICACKGTIIYVGNFKIANMNAAGKRVLANAKLFQKCGYKVVLVGNDSLPNDTRDMVVIDDVSVHSFGMSKRRFGRVDIWAYFQVFISILKCYNNVSHIICYGSPSLSLLNMLIMNYAHKKEICVITDVVDWLGTDSGNYLYRNLKQADTDFRNGYVNLKFDKIIVISQWLKEYYSKNYTPQNIIVIPPLVVSKQMETYPHNNTVQLVYAGVPFTLNKRITDSSSIKDRIDIMLKLLLAAKKREASFHLSIYGFTQEELLFCMPSIENAVRSLSDSLHFYGRVPMDVVNKALESADFTFFLRKKNRTTMAGFPTKIVESLCAGVPIITTETSDISDYTSEGSEVFYLDLEHEERAVDKLVRLFELDKNERDQNRRKCYNNENFLIDTYVNSMSRFLS